jgi:ring-1,2-phenylacetyl-CoA epoxidase subunit PaaE
MMQNLEQVVTQKGIDKKYFHMEVFATAGKTEDTATKSAGNNAVVSVILSGKKSTVEVPAGQTILDAMLKAGYDAPYSCKSGACSTCIAKLTKGKVKMDACFALDDDEIKKGYILACQAKPTTDDLEVNFDV